jgi:hypothetical protein
MPILQDQVSEKLQNIACGSQLNSRPLTTSALTLPFLSLTSLVNLHFKSVFLLFFSYHFFSNLLLCFLLHMAFQYDFM